MLPTCCHLSSRGKNTFLSKGEQFHIILYTYYKDTILEQNTDHRL